MTGPRVTVYLPTRNRAQLLGDAVESVLAQDYCDFELIIVDDASEDTTPEVAARYVLRDPRVFYVRQPVACGAPSARNCAIGRARGTFITGIDDDDLMLPQRLTTLLAAHDARYAFICSGFFHEHGGWRRPVFAEAREIRLADLLHYNVVGNQALMLTERVRAIGGFDEALVASQDYDLWTRLVQHYGPARRIAGPSYVFRQGAAIDGISASEHAGQGARQYARKHGASMTPAQRRSQRLVQAIATQQQVRLAGFADYLSWATLPVLLRYWASSIPAARSLRQHYRKLRWRIDATR